MEGRCYYPCVNKSSDGYCLTTGCINQHYQYTLNNYKLNISNHCKHCPNNPTNGGSGICNCVLGTPKFY